MTFVKDKSNLASTNIWSCGEYSQNISSFTSSSNTSIVLSDEYSNIGNYSIKATPNDPQESIWFRVKQNISQLDKEYPVTCKIYINCVDCSAKFTIQLNYIEPIGGESYKSNNVTIPANTTGIVTITDTVDDNIASIQFQINMNDKTNNSVIYLDTIDMLL